jgi:disulfide bond formation protein DsbB
MTSPKEKSTQSARQMEINIEIPLPPLQRTRIRFALSVAFIGFIFFLIGAQPGWFFLDRSPVVGFVQIAVMLIGLAIMCIGGYVAIHALWRKQPPSIPADIGLRFVSTGYVVTVFSGMADIFGIGSHPLPGVPLFGVWQARGMEIGLAFIAIGFVMMFPFRQSIKK